MIDKIKDVQSIELDMLMHLDSICKKIGIQYFLAGGTLLGAIRHKGFIPWDDDVDVAMPRPDYERFINLDKSVLGCYFISHISKDEKCSFSFAKFVDSKTQIVRENGVKLESEIGLSIDVFPIDGFGNNYKVAKSRLFIFHMLAKKVASANIPIKYFYRVSSNKSFFNFFISLLFKLVCFNKRKKIFLLLERMLQKKEYDKSLYIASTHGLRREKELIEKKHFAKIVGVQFENHIFPAPTGYDQYLRQMYGDYMSLPPMEQRVSPHQLEIIVKE